MSGLIVLVAMFVAGAAVGVVVDRVALQGGRQPIAFVGGTNEPASHEPKGQQISDDERRAMLRGIPFHFEHLGLTPQEEHTLATISSRRRPRADSIMRALRPVASRMETEMMQEMLCALTPAQQAHWLAYMDTLKFDPAIAAERYRLVRTHACGSVKR